MGQPHTQHMEVVAFNAYMTVLKCGRDDHSDALDSEAVDTHAWHVNAVKRITEAINVMTRQYPAFVDPEGLTDEQMDRIDALVERIEERCLDVWVANLLIKDFTVPGRRPVWPAMIELLPLNVRKATDPTGFWILKWDGVGKPNDHGSYSQVLNITGLIGETRAYAMMHIHAADRPNEHFVVVPYTINSANWHEEWER